MAGVLNLCFSIFKGNLAASADRAPPGKHPDHTERLGSLNGIALRAAVDGTDNSRYNEKTEGTIFSIHHREFKIYDSILGARVHDPPSV